MFREHQTLRALCSITVACQSDVILPLSVQWVKTYCQKLILSVGFEHNQNVPKWQVVNVKLRLIFE